MTLQGNILCLRRHISPIPRRIHTWSIGNFTVSHFGVILPMFALERKQKSYVRAVYFDTFVIRHAPYFDRQKQKSRLDKRSLCLVKCDLQYNNDVFHF